MQIYTVYIYRERENDNKTLAKLAESIEKIEKKVFEWIQREDARRRRREQAIYFTINKFLLQIITMKELKS